MSRKNGIGALLFIALFFGMFLIGDERVHYLNSMGLVIVLSGTLGAAFLSYPFEELRAAWAVARRSYTAPAARAHEIVEVLLDLCLKSRQQGVLALESDEQRTDVSFLRGALVMLVDGFERDEIEDILTSEIYFFQRRRQRHERVFRHLARLAPAFGITGSVIGLIAMLVGIGDTGVILRTIPMALTSTLYGIVLGNLFLTPIAENIHFKTQRELLMQELVLDGVLAICEERNSHKLERKLKSYLTPAQRNLRPLSLKEIRERYRERQLAQGVA